MLFPVTFVYGLTFTANVDSHQVQVGSSFLLTLTADEQLGSQPDLSALKQDFEVINTSQSNQMQIVNGQYTSKTVWKIYLLAKTDGYVVIPPIRYDDQQTKPITLKVSSPSKTVTQDNTQAVFIEASIDKSEAYVQEQIIYTLQLYRRVQLRDPSLEKPELEGVVMEQMDKGRSFQSSIKGHRYEVNEYRFALYPQENGQLIIPPAVLSATVSNPNPRNNSRNSFFNPFASTGKSIRIKSEALTLTIKPIPSSYPKGSPWIPSTAVSISENWTPNPPTFKIGEPVTRTLTVKAIGVAESLLPPLPLTDSPHFKIYPEPASSNSQLDAEGVTRTRVESFALIPSKTGAVSLPGVKLHWWDTESDSLQTAALPVQTVTVQAGAIMPQAHDSNTPELQETPAENNSPSPQTTQNNTTWFWVALIAIGLWLTTLFILLITLRNNKKKTNSPPTENMSPYSQELLKKAHRRLVSACKDNCPATTEKALTAWASQLYQDRNIRSLGAIKQHTDNKKVLAAIGQLEAVLYEGTDSNTWNARLLLEVSGYLGKDSQSGKEQPALAALYP